MFVDRDNSDKITGVFACRQYADQEEVADDAAEVVAFLAPKPATWITNAQLKRQLAADSRLDAAKTAVTSVDGLSEALWYGAAMFERDDPLLTALANAIGYDTDAKLDTFFEAASKL